MLCHHFFPLMLDAQCKKPDLIMNINHLVTMQFAVHNWLSSYAMEAMVEGADVAPHAAYCWQNAFKYLWRWPYKSKPLEDLKKARWYLNRLIEELEE